MADESGDWLAAHSTRRSPEIIRCLQFQRRQGFSGARPALQRSELPRRAVCCFLAGFRLLKLQENAEGIFLVTDHYR
jgi:hypothetical protein